MAILPILVAPHPVLKQTARPVAAVDKRVATLMRDMLETMYEANGIGLAAPQVGVSERIIVVDVHEKDEPNQPFLMANPEVVWESQDLHAYEEGCLSVPEHYAEVVRPASVTVRYLDENGAAKEIRAEDTLAVCLQHEIDHLNGVLFVDHLSSLKRSMILRKLQKQQRQKAPA